MLGDHPQGGIGDRQGRPFRSLCELGQGQRHDPASAIDQASLTLEQALELLAEKAAGGGATGGGGRLLGEHPEGGKVTVRPGRFGAYVNWGKINATLAKGASAEDVTLEEALQLIEAKGGAPKKSAKKAPAKKAAGKKTPTNAKKKIEDSDEAPFDESQPVKVAGTVAKKPAAKKAPAKKLATKKAAAK